MNIGASIKAIRINLSVTQSALAEKCNLSQTALSQIEKGVKRPSLRTLHNICKALDVPELVIYVIAMKNTEIPDSKKVIFAALYPTILELTLQLIDATHAKLFREG